MGVARYVGDRTGKLLLERYKVSHEDEEEVHYHPWTTVMVIQCECR